MTFGLAQASNILDMKKPKSDFTFNFHSLSFFKNNEFETKLISGYTLTGYQLFPNFYYNIEDKTSVSFGATLLKYSGIDHFTETKAYYCAILQTSKNMNVTIGSFFIDDDFIEPMYCFENHLTNRQKDGIKIHYITKETDYNLWINWREFIFEGSDYQEEFTIAFSKIQKEKSFIFLPIQFLITHQGGEIDSCIASIQSLANATTGINFNFSRNYKLENYILWFRDISGEKKFPISQNKGNAYFTKLTANFYKISSSLGYFYSESFYSSLGNPLFWTYSKIENKSYVANNVLMTLSYQKQILDKMLFEVDIKGNYDLYEKRLNYSYMMYVSFDEIFDLK